MASKREQWVAEVNKIRNEFSLTMTAKIPGDFTQRACYGCGQKSQIGDKIGWNVFGWTFHPEHLPVIKLPPEPAKEK